MKPKLITFLGVLWAFQQSGQALDYESLQAIQNATAQQINTAVDVQGADLFEDIAELGVDVDTIEALIKPTNAVNNTGSTDYNASFSAFNSATDINSQITAFLNIFNQGHELGIAPDEYSSLSDLLSALQALG